MPPDPYADIQRFILVSDLDGTLIDPGLKKGAVDATLGEFAAQLQAAGKRLTLWYNGSRPLDSQRESLTQVAGLPTPAFHICAMGTQIADHEGRAIEAYGRETFGDWPRHLVGPIATKKFRLEPHTQTLQTRYKASYNLKKPDKIPAIEAELKKQGIEARLVFSGGKDLDILPPGAGKAAAIKWLCKREKIAEAAIIVAGDSANDMDMFAAPFRGIVVGNGHDELKKFAKTRGGAVYVAKGKMVAGVLEGLRHFGVLKG